LYIEKIFGHQPVRTPSHVGGRLPATCSALGKVLLADAGDRAIASALDEPLVQRTGFSIVDPSRMRSELCAIRSAGHAFDREECNVGLTCVAVPIHASDGRSAGALSIAGMTGRFSPENFVGTLQRAAEAIGRQIHVV
jgi:IclR family transcriptional regulator, KDG regulon repressor